MNVEIQKICCQFEDSRGWQRLSPCLKRLCSRHAYGVEASAFAGPICTALACVEWTLAQVVALAAALGLQGCGGKTFKTIEEGQAAMCNTERGQDCYDYCLECVVNHYEAHKQLGSHFDEQMLTGCMPKVCPPDW